MSIESPLFQALAILHKNPEKSTQTTFQTQNAGCWKLNQKIWSCVFVKKKAVKLKNFQQFDQPRFAASFLQSVGGFCASSDASSESGKNDILKLSLSLPNKAQEVVKEAEMGDAIEGPEIEDGGGEGGNGNNGGKHNNNNNNNNSNNNGRGDAPSEGGNNGSLLRGPQLWWWWQWQRVSRQTDDHVGGCRGCGRVLCRVDSLVEMLSAEMVNSLQLALPPAGELLSQLKSGLEELTHFVMMVSRFFFMYFTEFPQDFARFWNTGMGAFFALFVAVPVAAVWGFLLWWGNSNRQDDGVGNDVEGDDHNDEL